MSLIRAPGPACVSRRAFVREGFTLVELIIVLAIIGVLTALAMPRWGAAVSRQRVESAAKRVAADLRLARTYARASSAAIEVRFDPPGALYSIPGIKDPLTGKSEYLVQLDAPPYEVTMPKASFGGIPVVCFNSFGVPSAAGSVVVGRGLFVRSIDVAAETGEVTIQ